MYTGVTFTTAEEQENPGLARLMERGFKPFVDEKNAWREQRVERKPLLLEAAKPMPSVPAVPGPESQMPAGEGPVESRSSSTPSPSARSTLPSARSPPSFVSPHSTPSYAYPHTPTHQRVRDSEHTHTRSEHFGDTGGGARDTRMAHRNSPMLLDPGSVL